MLNVHFGVISCNQIRSSKVLLYKVLLYTDNTFRLNYVYIIEIDE